MLRWPAFVRRSPWLRWPVCAPRPSEDGRARAAATPGPPPLTPCKPFARSEQRARGFSSKFVGTWVFCSKRIQSAVSFSERLGGLYYTVIARVQKMLWCILFSTSDIHFLKDRKKEIETSDLRAGGAGGVSK